KAKKYFDVMVEWPQVANALELRDANGQPMIENSDGLAHVMYLMLELEKHQWWDTTFLLEEPDAYLHPGFQRQFIRYLVDYLEDTRNPRHQFIITTHSPYVINAIAELLRSRPANVDPPRVFQVQVTGAGLKCSASESDTDAWTVLDFLGHRPS